MSQSKCKSNIKTLHAFLNATKGNWRNSLYIECSICKYEKTDWCEDHLFAADSDGTPLLIPVSDANIVFARIADKSECLGIIKNVRFTDLFSQWFSDVCNNVNECPLVQVEKILGSPKNW